MADRPPRRFAAFAFIAAVAAVAAVATGAAGCASIPMSGPVHSVVQSPGAQGASAPDLTVLAQQPVPGESPSDLVRGFLVAAGDSENDYAVARSFLTAAANSSWHPTAFQTIYDASNLSVSGPARGAVSVQAKQVATVDASGQYQPEPGRLRVSFGITRVSGQWRISRPPGGLLLSTADFQQTFRPVTVYFLAEDTGRLAAAPVYLRARLGGLPTALVRALLDGPGPALAGAVRTDVPPGTTLTGQVSIAAGVATVPLSRQVGTLSGARLRGFDAELAWTLGQLGGVSTVRVTGPSGVQTLSPAAFSGYDPDAATAAVPSYAVVGANLRRLGTQGQALARAAGLSELAVSANGRLLAGVEHTAQGDVLLSGPLAGPLRPVGSPVPAVLDPSFSPDGSLWGVVVPNLRFSPHQELARWVGGALHPVSVPNLARLGGPVTAFAVSRDGTRVALVAGDSLWVGPVTYGSGGIAVSLVRVLSGLADVSDIGWRDAVTVAVLGAAGGPGDGPAQPLLVSIDGSSVSSLPVVGVPTPTQLAVAPGSPTLLAAGGNIYQETGSGNWRVLVRGSDPVYQGG